MQGFITKGLLIQSLKPLYLMGLTLGVSPYVIKNSKELHQTLQAKIQTLILFIYQLSMLYIIQTNEVLENLPDLVVTVSYVSTMCFRSFSVFFVILEYLNRHKFCEILSDLQHVDDVIGDRRFSWIFCAKICYKKVKRLIWFLVLFLVSEVLFTMYTYYWYTLFVNYIKRPFLANFVLYYESVSIVIFIVVKIIVVNFVLRQRFKVVNKVLENNAEPVKNVSKKYYAHCL